MTLRTTQARRRRNSMRTAECATLLLLALLASRPSLALAHGGPPSALGLIAAAGAGPEVVLLNEGLALKTPMGWSFLCPSLWGELDLSSGKLPLARSADGATTWIIGSDGLYMLKGNRIATPQRPELGRNKMIALANDSEFVYGLHLTVNQTIEVVRLSTVAEAALWSSADYWSAITASSAGIHVARVAGDNLLEVATLDRQGRELSRARAMLSVMPFEMQLQASGDRLYATVSDGALWQVGYFEAGIWNEVLQDRLPILGPQVNADGTLWLAVGGMLARLEAGVIQPAAVSGMVSCLDQWGDWTYACVGSDLYRLSAAGLGDRIFGIDGMYGPQPSLVGPLARDSCDQQWVIYNFDAMRSGFTFMEWPAQSAVPSAGAAGAPSAGAPAEIPTAGNPAPASSGASQASHGCSVATPSRRTERSTLLWMVGLCGLGASLRRRRGRRTHAHKVRFSGKSGADH